MQAAHLPLKRSSANRNHHLLKTFWGWRDQQSPDGTVEWISPSGQTNITHPGSRLLFPSLCRPTAPITATDIRDTRPNRALMMPRRTTTRAHDRAARNDAERQRNDTQVAERNKPPPF
ncbi:hypothetical protein [Mycobacterium deserti]|uniref:hypothetical protein n=1 Tax=Mycobacterium deserti TaxID=2978347 RepID=UPI0028D79028|nr:hypothetical protein [Mycobacterium deserti]